MAGEYGAGCEPLLTISEPVVAQSIFIGARAASFSTSLSSMNRGVGQYPALEQQLTLRRRPPPQCANRLYGLRREFGQALVGTRSKLTW